MTIPDEIVEKAAKVFSKNGAPNVITLRRTRAALIAVLPDLIAAAVAGEREAAALLCDKAAIDAYQREYRDLEQQAVELAESTRARSNTP